MTSATMNKTLVDQKRDDRERLEQAYAEFIANGGSVYQADVTEHKHEDLTGNERRKMIDVKRGFFAGE